MYNEVTLIGNLTRDIELRYMPNGSALAKSAIATSHKYKTQSGEQKEEVCFLDFSMFGKSAEIANQYLRKGSKVLLVGRLVFEQWQDQQGNSRSKHALRVETMKMLDGKQDNQGLQNQQSNNYQPQGQQYQQPAQNQQGMDFPTDDEIPFIPLRHTNSI